MGFWRRSPVSWQTGWQQLRPGWLRWWGECEPAHGGCKPPGWGCPGHHGAQAGLHLQTSPCRHETHKADQAQTDYTC